MGKHSNIGLYCQLYYILLKDYWHFFYLNRTLFASNSNTSRKLTIFRWKKYALKIFLNPVTNTFWHTLSLPMLWYSYHATPWGCWKCVKFSMWAFWHPSLFPECRKFWWCARPSVFTATPCDSKCNKSRGSLHWERITRALHFHLSPSPACLQISNPCNFIKIWRQLW